MLHKRESQLLKRVKLKDVAEAAGVSTSIASHALNNKPDGAGNVRIRPEVRARIKEAAAKMGYRAQRNAKTLRSKDSNIIGIISCQSSNPVHFATSFAITTDILTRGYDYILYFYFHITHLADGIGAYQTKRALDMMLGYNIKGLILSELALNNDELEEVRQLAKFGLPVVDISPVSRGDFPNITADFYSSSYNMAKSLVRDSSQNVAIVCSAKACKHPSVASRIKGISDACASVGVELQIHGIDDAIPRSDASYSYEATAQLLSTGKKPDIIFYSNDFWAFSGLKAVKQKGYRIPEDIAVCGFDGIDLASVSDPSLTTVAQPAEEIGHKAVEILFDMMDGGKEIKHSIIEVKCKPIYRESAPLLK